MNSSSVVHSDPEIMGGTPVFRGTRVPFQTLIDYLEGGHPLANFLDDFPTVSREQVISALEQAKEVVLTSARVEIALKCSAAKAEQVRPIRPFDARRRTI